MYSTIINNTYIRKEKDFTIKQMSCVSHAIYRSKDFTIKRMSCVSHVIYRGTYTSSKNTLLFRSNLFPRVGVHILRALIQ